MNAKMIVILMMVVLAGLFIWSKFYRKKEVSMMKLEIESFEATKRWLANKTPEAKNEAIEKNIALSIAQGASPDQAKLKAEKQLTALSV